MRERTRQRSVVAASVLAVVVGLALFLGVGQEPVTYGWFAYRPLDEAPPGAGLNQWGWTGAALVVLGIVGLLAVAVTLLRVRRSAARR